MIARPEPPPDDLPPLDGDDEPEAPTSPGFAFDPSVPGDGETVDFDDAEAGDLGDGAGGELDDVPDVSGDDGDATDLDIGAFDGDRDTLPPGHDARAGGGDDGAGDDDDADGPSSVTRPGLDLADLVGASSGEDDDAEGPAGAHLHESDTELPELDEDDDGGAEPEAGRFFERGLLGGRAPEPPLADRPWTVGARIDAARARALLRTLGESTFAGAPAEALAAAADAVGDVEATAPLADGVSWVFVATSSGSGRRLVLAGAPGRALEVVAELPAEASGDVHEVRPLDDAGSIGEGVVTSARALVLVVGDFGAVPLCPAGRPIDEARLGVLFAGV